MSGFYTGMVGDWQVRVTIADNPQQASFTLPVTATAPKPAKAPPPTMRASTWATGAAELLAVLVVLVGTNRLSRYLTARRSRTAATGPDDGSSESTDGVGEPATAFPVDVPARGGWRQTSRRRR